MSNARPARYVILGALQQGPGSGYDIARLVELSARFFWAVTPHQIYGELKALEAEGLITGTDQPAGRRPRRVYSITPEGLADLKAWLNADDRLPIEVRDLGMVKLFFLDAADDQTQRDVVRRLRERSERVIRRFEQQILPVAQAGPARFPLETAQLGVEYHRWLASWFTELEQRLDQQPRADGAS